MAPRKKTQTEILKEIFGNMRALAAMIEKQNATQATTVRILQQMQEEMRRNQEGNAKEPRDKENPPDTISPVLASLEKKNLQFSMMSIT